MLLPAVAYTWLQKTIERTGRRDPAALAYYGSSTRKGWFAVGLYAAGAALTAVLPWFGIAAAGLVAIFWFLPASGIDRWFGPSR
ncbi:hypothetical protein [Sphingomonas sp.]|uniref:hypothetical protein n=1 Tax=Sphingomonas sp. TaxID=28214 RepID=UPI003AFFC0DB